MSARVNQWRRENFSGLTALVLAEGSTPTFNPEWVTGVCWRAEEGQEGTLLPRPLRSHAVNSWAASDSGVRGNVAGSTGLPLGNRLTTRQANAVDPDVHHIHVHTLVYTPARQLGNMQSERWIWTEDTCKTETANRIKLLTDCGQVCLAKDCRAALPDHVQMLFALLVTRVPSESSFRVWRMSSLRNGRSPRSASCWAPAI